MQTFYRALIIEDEPQALCALRPLLQHLNIAFDHAQTAQAGLEFLYRTLYDIVILDRGLPDGDGLNIISTVQSCYADTKILVLTAKNGTKNTVNGLQKGADDYLSKPFSPEEFSARVNALLRRGRAIVGDRLQEKGFEVCVSERRVQYGTQNIRLTPKECQLLSLFFQQKNKLLTRDQIALNVWTGNQQPVASTIDSVMKRLKQKIAPLPIKIEARYGVGYELFFHV